VILLIDQVTKVWAVATLENAPPIDVISGVFQFTFVRNPGAAFSLGAGSTMLVSLIAVVIVVVLMFRARNLRSVWWAIAMGGMIGGALGNLTDRVFRDPGGLRGHVVDFLALPFWPVFNVADMAVVGAAILMMVLALLGIDFDGTRHVDEKSADGDEADGEAPSGASGSAPGASESAPGASA
jgi:signal peptidase II